MSDGYFVLNPQGSRPAKPQLWIAGNLPAVYQAGESGMSFADGHSDTQAWKDKVLEMERKPPTSIPDAAPNKPDAGWLALLASTR